MDQSTTGTWTKCSQTVGPRRPFGVDTTIDYSFDEGLDWEPEDPAEVELGSDLEGDDDEGDSDDDGDEEDGGWMVGDDEIEFEDGAEVKIDAKAATGTAAPADVYTEVGKAGSGSKAQRFSRLVQTTLGPFWENVLCEVKPRSQPQYMIHLLNGMSWYAERVVRH